MFTFDNFPLVLILVMIVASWLIFFSAVPWGSLF